MKKFTASFVVLLGSITASAAEPGLSDKEVVLGSHISASGKLAYAASYGKALADYFDDVNAAGGIHGRKIKWIAIDSQSEHVKTVEATHTLVEQHKIFAMVGGQGASHIAVWKYLQEKGVPDMYPMDLMSEYVNPIKKGIFTSWYTNDTDGYAHGKYIADNFAGKKVCWLSYDGANAEEIETAAKRALKEANDKASADKKIKIGPVEKTERVVTQANSQVLKLKQEKCDVVHLIAYGPIAASVINFGVNQGFNPTWISWWANVTDSLAELIGKNVKDGTVVGTLPIAIADGMGAYDFPAYKKFIEKHKLPDSAITGRGFYIAELFTETLKRAGRDLSREKMIAAAETLNGFKCSLCASPIELSPTNHEPIKNPIFYTVRGGKWATLSTKK